MNTLNPALLAVILDQISRTPKPMIELAKPVAMALCCELMRFQKAEGADEKRRVEFVQMHTAQFMALHMADLIVGVRNDAAQQARPPDIDTILQFLINELERMANEIAMPPAGVKN